MKRKLSSNKLLIALLGLFIFINSIAILKEVFIIPLLTGAVALLYLLFFRADLLMYFMALITPFSIILKNDKINIGLSIPSEIIMIALTFLFLCRILYDISIDKRLLKHPVTIAILCYLGWMFFTCITSTLPLVSIKFLASKIWFITSCFFMVIQLIKYDLRRFVTFANCYVIGLSSVIIITTIKHYLRGFAEHGTHWIMSPFYNDHTAYGAVIALFIPLIISFYFLPQNTKWKKIFYIVTLLILCTGFYLSYSRAAWLSLIAAIAIWGIIKLKIKLSWLVIIGLLVGGLFYYYSDDIMYKMGRNQQDSSGNFVEHIQSISNISTDASNVERLNRWMCAFEMIKERPVVGWVPGTYQFKYAPFQKGKYKTIISTNFGNGGNAHSEYIGPWAETGTIGLITIFMLVILSLYFGIKTYIYSHNKVARLLSLGAVISLITYFIHGFFNNFLDTDKLSLPFWMLFALITVLNTYYMDKKENENKNDIVTPTLK